MPAVFSRAEPQWRWDQRADFSWLEQHVQVSILRQTLKRKLLSPGAGRTAGLFGYGREVKSRHGLNAGIAGPRYLPAGRNPSIH